MTDTALTPDEQARFNALYGSTPAAAAPDSPGVFDNALAGLAGIPSGLAGAPLSVASAATSMPDVFHSSILGRGYVTDFNLDGDQLAQLEKDSKDYFSTTWQYGVHKGIEDTRQTAADLYRPDPQTTGFVGNTLFGAADVLTRVGLGNLIAPGSGLAVAAGTTGLERAQDLEAQGVDSATSQASGVLTGVSLLAGGGISSLGKTVSAKVVSGALLNAGFGAGTRALDSAILDAHGYTAQAEQQRWNDGAALAADLIIGGAFHLLPSRGGEAKPASETVDAALTAKAAQGVTDSAPGVPADPKSASAHAAALDTAQAQLVDGKAVDVEPLVREATFAPRPEVDAGVNDAVRDAMVEAGVPEDVIARLDEPTHAPVVESANALDAAQTSPDPTAARTLGERVRGFLGRSKANPDAQASEGAVRADGSPRAAQPGNPAADGAANDGTRLDPARDGDVAIARQIAQETPGLVLDDGTTAADALRAADLDVQEAQRQAEGIGAAVACFLRFGAEA